MTKKVMKLVDPRTGKMECKVCGSHHWANLKPGGRAYYRGSWQCVLGCRLDEAHRPFAPTAEPVA